MKNITNPDALVVLNAELLLGGFCEYLTNAGKSENTISTYSRNISLFIKWRESETGESFDGFISDRIARNYLNALENHTNAGKHLSLSSIKAKMTALQAFCTYLNEKIGIPAVSVPQKKGNTDPKVEVLSKKELNRLLDYVDRKGTLLQKCVVSLLLNTGIRASELCNVELSDIEISSRKGLLKIRSGKGAKYREIPLNVDCRKAIIAYLAIRPQIDDSHLLIGQRGRMTRSGIYTMIRTIGEESINKPVYPHLLRHQLFTTLSKSGTDMKSIADLAGHTNINTTARYYISSSWEDKQNALESLNF